VPVRCVFAAHHRQVSHQIIMPAWFSGHALRWYTASMVLDRVAGHGTHVAGLVGANGLVVGMAPDVTFGAECIMCTPVPGQDKHPRHRDVFCAACFITDLPPAAQAHIASGAVMAPFPRALSWRLLTRCKTCP